MIRNSIEDYVTTIPDFPEPGILFRDITTVLEDPDGLKLAIDSMKELVSSLDFDVIPQKLLVHQVILKVNQHMQQIQMLMLKV